ncbi:hypothetical protein HKD37_01G002227 [Glycine soja]
MAEKYSMETAYKEGDNASSKNREEHQAHAASEPVNSNYNSYSSFRGSGRGHGGRNSHGGSRGRGDRLHRTLGLNSWQHSRTMFSHPNSATPWVIMPRQLQFPRQNQRYQPQQQAQNPPSAMITNAGILGACPTTSSTWFPDSGASYHVTADQNNIRQLSSLKVQTKFSLVMDKQFIKQMGSHTDAGWEWNYIWRRPLFDNEVAMAVGFLGEAAQTAIQPNRVDSWDGAFVELWKLRIPAKSAVFAWRLIRDRLPTKSNLRRRQVEVNDMLCPFCSNKEEDAAHLFFNCSKILPLWWESLSWVNIVGAFPQNPRDHFLQHGSGIVDGIKSTRWKCWWVALTWTIWQQRNRIVFLNETFNGSKLLDNAVLLIWTWFKSMEKDFALHYNQWSTNLREDSNEK